MDQATVYFDYGFRVEYNINVYFRFISGFVNFRNPSTPFVYYLPHIEHTSGVMTLEDGAAVNVTYRLACIGSAAQILLRQSTVLHLLGLFDHWNGLIGGAGTMHSWTQYVFRTGTLIGPGTSYIYGSWNLDTSSAKNITSRQVYCSGLSN